MTVAWPALKRWLVVIGVVLAIFAPLAMRVVVEGRAELQLAEEAARARDIDRQIMHLGRSARWRMPGTDHQLLALAHLRALADEFEAHGDIGLETALAAHREIRRALLATRTFSVTYPTMLAQSNAVIARLMARQEQLFGNNRAPMADREALHAALLDAPVPGLSPISLLASGGFLLWIASICGFVTQAIQANGRLRRVPAFVWGALVMATLVTWMWATRHAAPDFVESAADRSPANDASVRR